ncbi:MAG TPA: ATP-binding protein [Planctomycetota bacterium]|nr:ATP-binding protein [Planctomycetota bacterium]
MFRSERKPRFFERRWIQWGVPGAFGGVSVLALAMLWNISRTQAGGHLAWFLGAVVVVLGLTGAALFLVYQAYSETRDRLSYVKLYAHDILQSISIGVVTSDLAGRITNVNPRARELASIGEDGVQRPFGEVLGHVPALVEKFNRLTRVGDEFSGVDVDVQVGDRKPTLRLDGRFLHSHSGERIGVILQIQDVTHLKFLDLEMRRTEKLAGLGTVAAGIAHEIKNPLAALSIHEQLLEEAIQASTLAKAGKYLGIIRSEIHRLQGIVDKYVSFSRPSTMERSLVDLERILEAVLALVEPECRKQKVTILREGFSESPSRYLLDEGQIQQALLNIIINAIQAMPSGGSLKCRLGRSGAFATIAVEDTGPGIPPEVRSRIFDPFYTTRQGGTGLGLYLTQRIVSEHKGYINVEGRGAGTTFTIGLPAEIPK